MGRYLRDKADRRAGLDILPPEEEDLLLRTTLMTRPSTYPLLLAAVRTGLRIGELFGLRWEGT